MTVTHTQKSDTIKHQQQENYKRNTQKRSDPLIIACHTWLVLLILDVQSPLLERMRKKKKKMNNVDRFACQKTQLVPISDEIAIVLVYYFPLVAIEKSRRFTTNQLSRR